jgi:RNase P protein component
MTLRLLRQWRFGRVLREQLLVKRSLVASQHLLLYRHDSTLRTRARLTFEKTPLNACLPAEFTVRR